MICLAIGQRWMGSDALDSIASVRRRWPIGVTEMHKSDMAVLRQLAENTDRLELNEWFGLLASADFVPRQAGEPFTDFPELT